MLFSKRSQRLTEHSLKDKAAIKVAKLLLKIQDKFSKVMSIYTKNIAVKKLKALLVAFCLLGGGSSIYLIAEAILKNELHAFKIEKIEVPKYYDQDSAVQTQRYVAPESYEALRSFRRYMDSLQQDKLDSMKLLKQFNSKIKL